MRRDRHRDHAAADHSHLHARHRERGVNPLVYWLVRAVFQPFFHLYFRLSRIGREHVPESGPVIFAANHRSFLDPFVIATIARRPMYYVAKEELFRNRLSRWLLNALGAFPVDRGQGDADMIDTAQGDPRARRRRADLPRGHAHPPRRARAPASAASAAWRSRPARPSSPSPSIGTEAIRKGWRIRPHKVRIRVGRPLTFPRSRPPSPQLAAAVTDRIWPNVMLQWEWLGGLPPLRRAAVIGAGSWGTAVAVMLARAGLEVDLGCRTLEQADGSSAARCNEHYLRGHRAARDACSVMRAADLELSRHDLVVFAVPAAHLPAAVAAHGGAVPPRAGVLVCAKGLVPPLGHAARRLRGRARRRWAVGAVGGPAHAAAALSDGASLVLAAPHAAFARQLSDALGAAGLRRRRRRRTSSASSSRAAPRTPPRWPPPPPPARAPTPPGAAAGKVFAEVDAYARRSGSRPGDVRRASPARATSWPPCSPPARATAAPASCSAQGMPAGDIGPALGQTAEAVDCVPLLAARVRDAGRRRARAAAASPG